MTDEGKFGIEEFMQTQEDYAELEPDALNDAGHLVINWGRKGIGFGQLSFQERDGVLHCDNETMGREFCTSVLVKLTESLEARYWPPLVRRFPTLEALLDAAVPHYPGDDWGEP